MSYDFDELLAMYPSPPRVPLYWNPYPPPQPQQPPAPPTTPPPQTSSLLRLPSDIFSCVLDYLDRHDAWSLKRLCRGMATSDAVTQLLYRYPLQLNDVNDLRLCDWLYCRHGNHRWLIFQESISDANRHYVHRLALPHWVSLDDFRWIETNLPALVSLDLSAIKDFVWTPYETWTWRQLAAACPALLARLHDLDVANWADYSAHSRVEYSYGYNDYRFKQKFRLSRRRDGGSIAQELFPACTSLKTLGIREHNSGFHDLDSTWNEWEVHQRVCGLVDGIQKHSPPSLNRLRVHDYSPYRSLFSTDITTWPNITHVDVALYSWMEDRREREPLGPVPLRISAGTHHRPDEEALDNKTFDTCGRNHMTVGNQVVQGIGATFQVLLQSLHTISTKYPNIHFKPISNVENITLHPFHLVNVQRRLHFFHQPPAVPLPAGTSEESEPVVSSEVQGALRWLHRECDWKPILTWDPLMCDVFPANLEANRTFLPKPDIVSRIAEMITVLRDMNMPIRLSIGDRAKTCPASGVDGAMYFGDYKTLIESEGDDNTQTTQQELMLPTQARFNLAPIAHLVDELVIQYPSDMPSVGSWPRPTPIPTPAETALVAREKTGWRRFWARYAHQFRNLKKLTTNVPTAIYADWAHTALPDLLADERWQLLESEAEGDYGFHASYFPFSTGRFAFRSKHVKRAWVQRVFFREDGEVLEIGKGKGRVLGEAEGIPDEMIQDREGDAGRFWAGGVCEKREREDEDDVERRPVERQWKRMRIRL